MTRRAWPDSIRAQALELVTAGGKTYYEAAALTGVPHDTIRYWYRLQAPKGVAKPNPRSVRRTNGRATVGSGVITPKPYARDQVWMGER
jgi:transposase-like protein